ncbi:hypothetical protein D516_3960 [Rhodobacter sp. AKP1]|nr:hypothetical protein D516_3960 [Rhodobacter sp. AKP1]
MTNVSNSYLAWLEQEINVAEGIAIAVENGMLWFGAEVRPDEETKAAIIEEYRLKASALRKILDRKRHRHMI